MGGGDGVDLGDEVRVALGLVLDLPDGALDVAADVSGWDAGGVWAEDSPLDAAADGFLGVSFVVVRPDGVGVDVDGPSLAEEFRQLLLKVCLVVVPFVTDWKVSAKGDTSCSWVLAYCSCEARGRASLREEGGP
jgi:hypothetical protein